MIQKICNKAVLEDLFFCNHKLKIRCAKCLKLEPTLTRHSCCCIKHTSKNICQPPLVAGVGVNASGEGGNYAGHQVTKRYLRLSLFVSGTCPTVRQKHSRSRSARPQIMGYFHDGCTILQQKLRHRKKKERKKKQRKKAHVKLLQ